MKVDKSSQSLAYVVEFPFLLHKMQNTTAKQNRSYLITLVLILLLFTTSFLAQRHFQKGNKTPTTEKKQQDSYQRIIALAPSIVEIIYQLNLEKKLVGISKFCKHPPEASQKPIVGGFLDLNFEALLQLQPDCVVLLTEQQAIAEKLNELNIDTIIIDHASTKGITRSIQLLGERLGKGQKATQILSKIQNRIDTITAHKDIHPPKVLVCIGRDRSAASPSRITAAGNKGVHQEYITMAGGTNAYQGDIAYPAISREKLIHLNPDIIIELVSKNDWQNIGHDKLMQQWRSYGELRAAQQQNIIFLHENKHMIPGPRFVDTLEAFSTAIRDYATQ